MKKLLYVLPVALSLLSCDPYKAEVEYLRQEAQAVSDELDAVSASVQALTEIMKAMLGNDFVTSVEPVQEGSRSGYDLIFANSGKIRIYCGADGQNGQDGKDGKDGKDGVSPVVSIRQYSDGVWYWTVNGEWLRDSSGEKVRVAGRDGHMPQLKIVGEFWYVSYDDGETWERVASSVAGEVSIFKNVDYQSYDDYIVLTLKDGTVLQVPKNKSLNLSLYNYSTIAAGETVTLNYSVSGYDGTPEISCIEPEGWKAVVSPSSENYGTITVTAPSELVFQTILVFASSKGVATMRPLDFSPKAESLCEDGTANCYMVHKEGYYSFNASVKGAGPELIDKKASRVGVLWECPEDGSFSESLINELTLGVSDSNYMISFKTSTPFRRGNVVIALRNSSNAILWSWHIWLTDYDPEESSDTYKGHEGERVMSCNLGAFSSASGSSAAMGLLYQWGRKDPFPGSSSTSSSQTVKTSITWPDPVACTASTGTIAYATENPTRFITSGSDWLSESTSTLWGSSKTIYDPCPPGWRVPAGGADGMWSGFPSGTVTGLFDASRHGVTFSREYSQPKTWYPASGQINPSTGKLEETGNLGLWWSATSSGGVSYGMKIYSNDRVSTAESAVRATGSSVRCCKETAGGGSFPEGNYDDLSKNGTSNCYIVPAGGTYKFKADVKGCTAEALESTPQSACVVWETFGTAEKPKEGDIISSVSYKSGYVYLKMASPYRQGNALVAVKDRSGQILWSWHIWACSFDPQSGKKAIGGEYFMDRNLGALSSQAGDAASLGLLYNWGRKEPFMGSTSILDNGMAESTVEWSGTGESGWFTPENALRNPTVRYYGEIWRSRGDCLQWESDKNKYDPCPPGWRVMDSNPAETGTFVWDNVGRGASISGLWFPATGEDLYSVGHRGQYLIAREPENYSDGRLYYPIMYFNVNSRYTTNHSYWNRNSVRCIRDSWAEEIGNKTVTNLSVAEAANCYMVSKSGLYKFKALYKGNSFEKIDGTPYSASVLWETDNSSSAVSKGSIVSYAKYHSGYIYFEIPAAMKKGNALIAVKNQNGTTLWSWHIWVTDYVPSKEYELFESLKTYPVMDRNLGALSDKAGSSYSHGLFYQWGRKDPFTTAAVSGTEFSTAVCNSSYGTISYTYNNPTVFIKANDSKAGDWLYLDHNKTLWGSSKTMYDPCPAGWRVPDGGEHGLWKAFTGSSASYWNASQKGLLFSTKYSSPESWYPASGYLDGNGSLTGADETGSDWSCTFGTEAAACLVFDSKSVSQSAEGLGNACGRNVRCIKDFGDEVAPAMDFYFKNTECSVAVGMQIKLYLTAIPSGSVLPSVSWSSSDTKVATVSSSGYITGVRKGSCTITATYGQMKASCKCTVAEMSDGKDLSLNESANCYLASTKFTFKFKPYKGNSRTLLDGVSVAAVLWEGSNSSVAPKQGDIISSAGYSGGYVRFSTGTSTGNAVIAVKDASGNILWSWHIWVTDYNPDGEYDTFKSGAKMMNRNLGALSNAKGNVLSLGLMYQWGRKDPFPGGYAIRSNSSAKVVPDNIFNQVDCTPLTGTVEYAVNNPTTFIKTLDEDWTYTHTHEDTRWQHEKTIYDPCPPGWRVPDGGDSGSWSKIQNYSQIYDSSNRGMLTNGYSNPQTWIPYSGHIDCYGNLTGVGSYAYHWTTRPQNILRFYFNGISVNIYNTRADGYPLRCVMEE